MEWFRTRPLEKEYPVIWGDALDEKVRCERPVISMAVAVVQGITKEGNRAILAVEPLDAESMRPILTYLNSLKDEEWKPSGFVHPLLMQG